MKYFLFCLFALFLSYPTYANDGRVESVALQIYADLEKERFDHVEKQLQAYTEKDIKTRHGTDTILEVYEEILDKIRAENSFEKWDGIESSWQRKTEKNFLKDFFSQLLKHAEAEHYTTPEQAQKLLQSQRRRYKDTLNNGYNRYLRLLEDYPKQWRAHAYIVDNYNRYSLTEAEVNEHFIETQGLKKDEVTSMKGYLSALSPHALGRGNKVIAEGIESVLKKYPDRNLSKPEYIDDEIKQEIQDEIFEIAIGKMLLTTRKYVESSPSDSTAPLLIPMIYKVIQKDIEKHYEGRPEKIAKHPLSLKREAVWHEVEGHFARLIKNHPKSGKYLSGYLELALERNDTEKVAVIINTIMQNDPNYKPAELKPIQCEYFGKQLKQENKQDTINKMYAACKSAANYQSNETFLYRVGWAARQKGNFQESNEYLAQALNMSPKNATYLTDICWNHKDLKQYDEALDFCSRAIEINDKLARAWLGRSHIQYYGFNNRLESQKDAKIYKSLIGKQ